MQQQETWDPHRFCSSMDSMLMRFPSDVLRVGKRIPGVLCGAGAASASSSVPVSASASACEAVSFAASAAAPVPEMRNHSGWFGT